MPLARGLFVMLTAIALMVSLPSPAAFAAAIDAIPTVDAFAVDKTRTPGWFPLLVDEAAGEVYVEVPNDRGDFIFQTSLPRGVGSNDLGLDRGRLEDTALVHFQRIGGRALLRARNTRFRADSASASERSAAEQAFATSVLAGLEVVAADADRYVVHYTPFLLSDVTRIAAVLADADEGSFRVDTDRSAPWFERNRAFPRNTELEAVLTLTGDPEGDQLRTVTPMASALTVHVHHSLIALPEAGYEAREFHPRSGFFPHAWVDFASPLNSAMTRRVIPRHRLQAVDPQATPLRPVEPIVYYLDPGVPEPVRSALLDGASWWNQAFEAIGWQDAFQVRMLPPDADPMDLRYNVIQWVHRSTRGWSYGMSVRDPRTGEILKGHVTLGSLRVRQDLLIARALAAETDPDAIDEATLALALARLRQLSAHEVGHTLGLAHNFAASTQNRSSVMDYPHPQFGDPANPLDADAYAVGIGAWDKHSIRYGYTELAPATEDQALARVLDEAQELAFMSDPDARAMDAAHPAAHLWDGGAEPVAELEHLLAVRRAALARFDARRLPRGAPRSDLEAMLVPLYFLHRYQTEAVARLLGGLDYDYGQDPDLTRAGTRPVAAERQRQALTALLATLSVDTLALDADLVARITPQSYGHRRTREAPPGRMGPGFDALTPAEAAAEHTLSFLLAPGRLARLDQQHAMAPDLPGVSEVLDALVRSTVDQGPGDGLPGLVHRRVALLVVEHLATLAWNDAAAPEVTSTARGLVRRLESSLVRGRASGAEADHRARLADLLTRAREEGHFERRADVARMPPGSPI